MKKILFILAGIMCSIGMADAKSLVAYYSNTGNTETLAQKIAEKTGADTFKIETTDPAHYPQEYDMLMYIAQMEVHDKAIVDINVAPDLAEYDTVYVGTPVWLNTMSTPVRAFLHKVDLSGKTVIPFTTSGNSGLGNVPADIAELTPNSTHKDGLTVTGTAVADSDATIDAWLNKIQ